jgi:hypothetical protein
MTYRGASIGAIAAVAIVAVGSLVVGQVEPKLQSASFPSGPLARVAGLCDHAP